MNRPPLNTHEKIRDLRDWLHGAVIRKLKKIAHGIAKEIGWVGHSLPCRRNFTTNSQSSKRCSQMQRRSIVTTQTDGGGEIRVLMITPALWKQVWTTNGLPKVNFLFWILMQNKQLKRDNLSKRNIIGPHRCTMCRNSGETTFHLFIDCDFSKEVWNLTLLGLPASPPQHSSVANLFTEWFQCYPHNIPNKSLWFHIWLSIPKFVCWEIWLAWSDSIFNNSTRSPAKSASIEKSLLLEYVLLHSQKSASSLLPSKKAWLNLHSPHPINKACSLPPPLPIPSWKIREPEVAFKLGGRSKTQLQSFSMALPNEIWGLQELEESSTSQTIQENFAFSRGLLFAQTIRQSSMLSQNPAK